MIKIPGVDGKGIVDDYAGQVGVVPTILHLLGIRADDYIQFGTDLFSEDHNEMVAFRNGDFFTPEVSMIRGTFYNQKTGEELEPNEELEAIQKEVQNELEMSDKVLQGDLLRFHVPNENWSPVEPSDYFYDENQIEVKEALNEKWLGRPTVQPLEDTLPSDFDTEDN